VGWSRFAVIRVVGVNGDVFSLDWLRLLCGTTLGDFSSGLFEALNVTAECFFLFLRLGVGVSHRDVFSGRGSLHSLGGLL